MNIRSALSSITSIIVIFLSKASPSNPKIHLPAESIAEIAKAHARERHSGYSTVSIHDVVIGGPSSDTGFCLGTPIAHVTLIIVDIVSKAGQSTSEARTRHPLSADWLRLRRMQNGVSVECIVTPPTGAEALDGGPIGGVVNRLAPALNRRARSCSPCPTRMMVRNRWEIRDTCEFYS